VVAQFSRQHALREQLLELARQARLTQNRFGILVLDLGQQLVDQFDRNEARRFLLLWFFGGHCFGHGISLSVLFHDPGHTKNLTGSAHMDWHVSPHTALKSFKCSESAKEPSNNCFKWPV
jgi:hypothetical protein